jgi:MtN3 and saliva related transmembrane protein
MINTIFTIDLLGYVAGIVQTIRTVPQIVSSTKTKSTKDLSLWMILFSLAGALLWLAYGFMITSMPIIITDLISSFLLSVLLVIKLNFDRY